MATIESSVGVYVGQGASHSWTWLADICDRDGYCSVCFLDEQDIAAGALRGVASFFISGGDTFAIAQGLGLAGARAIEAFVKNGGVYIGACAGAYLPLNSSLAPLNQFNFVPARIANLTSDLPEAVARPEKFCTEYGCRYVYHPVRESVRLRLNGWGDGQTITAPLYGGPSLMPSDRVTVLAYYDAFTGDTEFLIDRSIAERALLGTAAVIKKEYGRGVFYLFGPHFEHPGFTQANRLLRGIMESPQGAQLSFEPAPAVRPASRQLYRELLSAVSNARIMALALERSAYAWLIGKKVYDPEKIRVFLEAVWERCRRLDSPACLEYIEHDDIVPLVAAAGEMVPLIRSLRDDRQQAAGDTALAERLFFRLRTTAAAFLTIYFRLKHGGVLHPQRRSTCTIATCISPQPQPCIRCRS